MTTHKNIRLMLTTGLLVILTGTVSVADAAYKCWTNKDGVRECGNAVPPEYAQQGYETKSNSGLTVDKSDAAKTIEVLNAERERDRAAAEQAAAAEAKAARQAAADRVLLDSFSSADDLILTRDGKVSLLDSQIKLTQNHIEKLNRNLNDAIQRAGDLQRRGEKPPKTLTDNIDSLRNQIRENETFINTKRLEQGTIAKQFDADIQRFNELKRPR